MTNPLLTESALALLIQEGRATDPAITNLLVQQFGPGVHHFTLGLLYPLPNAPETARMLTCQTFATALNDPESFAGKENIRAWLYAQVLRQVRALPAAQQAHALPPSAIEVEPSLNLLTKQEYLPVLLRYGHGFTLFDIAHLLRTSEKKIHQHLTHARQKLLLEMGNTPSPPPHHPQEIQRLLDGQLTSETEAALRDHLETCQDCCAYFKRFEALELHLTASLFPAPPLLEEQIREIMQAVIEYEPIHPQHRLFALFTRLPLREMGWVLAAAVGFFIVAWWLNPFFSSPPPPVHPTAQAEATLPPAQDLSTVFRQNNLAAAHPFPGQHVIWTLTDVQTGEHIPSTPIIFSPSTTYAAFGDGFQTILWHLDDPPTQTVYEGQAAITALEFFPSEEMLIAGDEAGNIWIWEMANERLRFHLDDIPGPIRNLAVSPNQQYLVAALNEGLWVWEVKERALQLVQKIRWPWVRLVTFSPDGQYLAFADRENTVSIVSFPEGNFLLRYEILENREEHRLDIVTRLAYAPDGQKLATGTFDGIVEVVALTPVPGGMQGTRLFALPHPSWISEVRWSPDGKLLAAVSDISPDGMADSASRAVYLWDTETGMLAHAPLTARITRGVSRAIFKPGGNSLLLSNFNGAIFTWSLEDVSHLVTAFPAPKFFTRAEGDVWEGSFPVEALPNEVTDPDLASGIVPFMVSPPSAQYIFVNARYSIEDAVFVLNYQTASGNTLVITQRLLSESEPSPVGRWIGASAVVQPVQIHGTMGEYVTGSWIAAPTDQINGENETPIYRWQAANEARLRWVQENMLMEISTPIFQLNRNNLKMDDLVHLAESLITQTEIPLLFPYTVQEGDTCFDIAFRYSTTTELIARTNQLNNCDLILIGQPLLIPLPIARTTAAEVDLNCDGRLERIRVIPEPNFADRSANFGVVVEAIPPGGSSYWPVWDWTIIDVPVSFFSTPEVFAGSGCEVFLGISSYGGTREYTGLDIFQWNGTDMVQVLDANGYALEVTPGSNGEPFRITTQSLVREPATGNCSRTTTIYVWNGTIFVQEEQSIEERVACSER